MWLALRQLLADAVLFGALVDGLSYPCSYEAGCIAYVLDIDAAMARALHYCYVTSSLTV